MGVRPHRKYRRYTGHSSECLGVSVAISRQNTGWTHKVRLVILLHYLSFRILDYLRQVVNSLVVTDDEAVQNVASTQSYTHVQEAWEVQELQAIIESILNEMPQIAQQIFRMRYIENLSVKETAAELSITESTVRDRLSSTLSSLRTEINLRYQIDAPEKLSALLPLLAYLFGE